MKKLNLLFSLFLSSIILLLSGCSVINSKNHTLDILEDQACVPPCWQGITPGTTTFDEAWTIARSLVSTDKNTSKLSPFSIDKDVFLKEIVIDYQSVSIVLGSDSQGFVDGIRFLFNPHYQDEPELQDLIEIYGTPIIVEICHELDKVWGIRRAWVWFLYPYVSFYYSEQLPLEGDSFTVHVKKDTRIEAIFYTSLEIDSLLNDFSFPWSGYGDLTITPSEKNPSSICP